MVIYQKINIEHSFLSGFKLGIGNMRFLIKRKKRGET